MTRKRVSFTLPLTTLTDKGIIWVTRIRGNALYRVLERRSTGNNSAVTSDQTIEYTGKQAHKTPLRSVRRIVLRGHQRASTETIGIQGNTSRGVAHTHTNWGW